MQGPPSGVSVEALLEHRGWVRALARSLAADEASADDLEQEAWLTALRRPPARDGGLRAWLASVVRSRAADARRSEGSRRGRERKAARPEAVPSSEDLARLAELQARVARAVVALEEPYRYAILLHYFHGLTVDGVATRTGVPRETARTRIRRALARLRDLLHADHDGDRRAWIALLSPVAARGGPSIPGTVVTGGILMTMKAKAGIAAAAVLLLAALLLLHRGSTRPVPSFPGVAAAPSPSLAPDAGRSSPFPVLPALPPGEETEPGQPGRRVEPPSPPPDSIMIRYTGRVLDERRRPEEGARVTASVEGSPVAAATTDGEGRFALEAPPPARGGSGGVGANLLFSAVTEDGRVGARPFFHGPVNAEFLELLVIVVGPGRMLEVEVSDATGPVPGSEIVAATPRAVLLKAKADAEGRAVLGPLPSTGDPLHISAAAPGRGRGSVSLPRPESVDGPVLLRLLAGDLAVEVVDAETGLGISGALLQLKERIPTARGGSRTAVPFRPAIAECRTDREGRALLQGTGASESLLLGAHAEGYGGALETGALFQPVVPGKPSRIALFRARTIRWPLAVEDGPIPAEGNVVRLLRGNGARSGPWRSFGSDWPPLEAAEGRIERDAEGIPQLVVFGVGGGRNDLRERPPFDAVAVAPDGRLALLHAGGDATVGAPASFREPRTATIEVLDDGGDPVECVEVSVTGTGVHGALHTRGFALTDAAGRAVLGGLYGGTAKVSLRDPRRNHTDPPVGTVDLEKGDAFLSLRLPLRTPVEFLVRVRRGGRPCLPPSYRFALRQGSEGSSFGEGDPHAGREDPDSGTLRVTAWLLWPRESLEASLVTGDPGSPRTVRVPAGERDGPVVVDFDLDVPGAPFVADGPAEARTVRILDEERTTLHVEGGTVAEALGLLEVRHGLGVMWGPGSREAATAPIVLLDIRDRSVRETLQEILAGADGLTFEVRGGFVTILLR